MHILLDQPYVTSSVVAMPDHACLPAVKSYGFLTLNQYTWLLLGFALVEEGLTDEEDLLGLQHDSWVQQRCQAYIGSEA